MLRFDNYKAQQIIPVSIICDFEALLCPLSPDDTLAARHGQTDYVKQHVPLSYGIKVVVAKPYQHLPCFQPFVNEPMRLTCIPGGEGLSKHFLEEILSLGNQLQETIAKQNQPLRWQDDEQVRYEADSMCHICDQWIEEDQVKVPDHDHLSGEYRGAAHQACNVNYNLKNLKIPVILHNFRGYDSKMILKDIGKLNAQDLKNLSVLAQNAEQFKSITLGAVRFIDSFQHLPSSLETLVKNLFNDVTENDVINLPRSKATFHHLAKEFKHLSEDHFRLLLRKGVFPYNWLDSPLKLHEPQLPNREDFFNDLKQEPISLEDYEHAQRVWEAFQMKTFQDYHDLYLKTDVLLLADVMDNYRAVTLSSHQLDPLNFLTAPSLSFNAALKRTKVELRLLTDLDMIHFFQRGIRGGLSYICKRRSQANVSTMGEAFDPSKPTQEILYVDANNLYGYAMSEPMPTGNFKWMSPEEFLTTEPQDLGSFQDTLNRLKQSPVNYVLEVDALVPDELHDYMSDFPFLPENMIPPGGKTSKLINHLGDRHRYIIAYEMMLLAREQGIQFPKIHRVLRYDQSYWLKPYIDLNTRLRMDSKNTFEQDYYKLLNNSVHGKFLEDVTKYVNFELFTTHNTSKYKKYHQRKPYMIKRKMVYHRCPTHEEDPCAESCEDEEGCVVGMEKKKLRIHLNKPIYIGFKVLELSKLVMYQFFYHVLKPIFGHRLRLLATDTDSFILEIESPNLNAELAQIQHHLDLSNYDKEHELYDLNNRKVPGKFKNEYPNKTLTKFVGLRAKCYALESTEGMVCKRAKGCQKSVVAAELSIQDYENCLQQRTNIIRTQHLLRSRQQTMYTVRQNKVALSANDDKRYTLPNQDRTIPWGHYSFYFT